MRTKNYGMLGVRSSAGACIDAYDRPAQDYSAVQSNGNLHLGAYGNFFIPGNTHPTIPPLHAQVSRGPPTRGCS